MTSGAEPTTAGAVLAVYRTALPIIGARLVQSLGLLLGFTMVAQVGMEDLAASALASSIFFALITFGWGSLFAIGGLVGRASGSADAEQISSFNRAGVQFAVILGAVSIPPMLLVEHFLALTDQPPHLVDLVGGFFDGIAFGIIPLLVAMAHSQVLIGLRRARVVFHYALLNLVLTVALAYGLIFGIGPFPELGLPGFGWALGLAGLISALALALMIWREEEFRSYRFFTGPLRFEKSYFFNVTQTGLPIGLQMSAELGAIMVGTLMMGWFGQVALAAQQVVAQYALFLISFPFGIGQAVSVMVGNSIGEADREGCQRNARAGQVAIGLFFAVVALGYWLIPQWLALPFVQPSDHHAAEITSLAAVLLAVTALSQLVDSQRNMLAAILRPFNDTRFAMWNGLLALWIVALPCGYLFAVTMEMGPVGLRFGTLAGVIVGLTLLAMHYRRSAEERWLTALRERG